MIIRTIILLILFISPAESMQFSKVTWRGHIALLATGNIVRGDAARLATAIKDIPRLPHGLPVMLLESGGGSVNEALKISGFLDEFPIHTVIPKGGKCASACASLVFVAGSLRTVEEGGLFGQHSCSLSGIANENCNKTISEHAFAHGVTAPSLPEVINQGKYVVKNLHRFSWGYYSYLCARIPPMAASI